MEISLPKIINLSRKNFKEKKEKRKKKKENQPKIDSLVFNFNMLNLVSIDIL